MSFKTRRFFAAALVLVISLLIQMQYAANGYASRGAKIAFTCGRDGNLDICVMDGDGGNKVRLTDHPVWDYNPSRSPDGTRIAFVSQRDRNRHVYVMDSDGQNLMRLTNRLTNWGPAWSPDGNAIAYVIWNELISTINLMTPDGRQLEQLSEDGFYAADPDWFDPVGRSVFPATNFVTIWGEIKMLGSIRR